MFSTVHVPFWANVGSPASSQKRPAVRVLLARRIANRALHRVIIRTNRTVGTKARGDTRTRMRGVRELAIVGIDLGGGDDRAVRWRQP